MSEQPTGGQPSGTDAEVAALLREQNALLREQQQARRRRARLWGFVAIAVAVILVVAIPVSAKIRADRAHERDVCEYTAILMGSTVAEAEAQCR